MIQTIIFDWDGTLHNTKHLYGTAFRKAYAFLVEQGLAPEREYSDEDVAIYLGMNSIEMWNTFMPQLAPEMKDAASKMIGKGMIEQVNKHEAILYPGALEILAELKNRGYHLVFLSNCRRAYMEAHRKEFGLDRYFDGFYCCEDYGFIPKEEIFPDIRKSFPGEFAVVGDRRHDITVAVKHDLFSVGCLYGFGAEEELAIASVRIQGIRDLVKML